MALCARRYFIFWTFPFGQTLFRLPFLNHPPTRNLASNLRVTCVHLCTNLGLGSKKSCSELDYGTLEGEEELPTGCARFPPSELQTTPRPRTMEPPRLLRLARLPVNPAPCRYINSQLKQRSAGKRARCLANRHFRPSACSDGLPVAGWRSGSRRRSPSRQAEHAAPGDSSPLAPLGCFSWLGWPGLWCPAGGWSELLTL